MVNETMLFISNKEVFIKNKTIYTNIWDGTRRKQGKNLIFLETTFKEACDLLLSEFKKNYSKSYFSAQMNKELIDLYLENAQKYKGCEWYSEKTARLLSKTINQLFKQKKSACTIAMKQIEQMIPEEEFINDFSKYFGHDHSLLLDMKDWITTMRHPETTKIYYKNTLKALFKNVEFLNFLNDRRPHLMFLFKTLQKSPVSEAWSLQSEF